ncbi:hypothetical protein [Clostridium baratii]|uniref:Rad50/SbcC-type AAA domain-containing protein n=1 Tax=Clostridium baratii TaxID=1561 RepID=A0A174QJU9_9CLOT|nr:hypothetical protein [Clostridium baratii]CUP73522.1 Uncharacterised protein [Clostridium baratii]
MSYNYIKLNELIIDGEKHSNIRFTNGLNVIHGTTNTGKSLILDLISYCMGSDIKSNFDDITELDKYHTSHLIITINKLKYKISRSLIEDTNKIIVYDYFNDKYTILYAKSNKNTFSNYLLTLLNLDNKHVRTPKKIENLTLHYLKEVALISEEKIIRKTPSPFLSGQNNMINKEKSAIQFFLSNQTIVSQKQVDSTESKSSLSSQKDLLSYLINEQENKLNEIKKTFNINTLKELENKLTPLTEIAHANENFIKSLENEKQDNIDKYNSLIDERAYIQQLINTLINSLSLFESDIKRLEYLVEGSNKLNNLLDCECPLCKHKLNIDEFEPLSDIYYKEYNEIILKKEECIKLLEIKTSELENINSKIDDLESSLQEISQKQNILIQDLDDYTQNLQELNNMKIVQSTINEIEDSNNTLNLKLQEIIEKISNYTPPAKYNFDLTNDLVEKYLPFIKSLLKGFNFEDEFGKINDINFNNKNYDLVINNKIRAANGKGVRALISSAMIIGFMQYLVEINHPHLGFVILDSPLLSLKERDKTSNDELLSQSIHDSFFTYLSKLTNHQIIILENEIPPTELSNSSNIIKFDKDDPLSRNGLL